jgi:ABC-type amino acid transport substrate-binding protein
MRRRCVLLLFAGALGLCAAASNAETYTYLRPEWHEGDREPYGMAMLKLALAKAHACHTLVMSQSMKQSRGALELEHGSGKVDIMITMTSRARESALLPITIPLTKGLLGWRIALVRADRLHQFSNVRRAADLRAFLAGQGHDWPDTEILRANRLKVHVSAAYEGMFEMLQAGRIDYFPRALQQVWSERDAYPRLAIEPHIVLRYPADAYFFVNRGNTRLAAEVRTGLEAAIADGSFDRLFYRYFARQIAAAALDQRRIIDLVDPLGSTSLPFDRPGLWFASGDIRRKAFVDALKADNGAHAVAAAEQTSACATNASSAGGGR